MTVSFEIIEDLSTIEVAFLTVRKGSQDLNEFEIFDKRNFSEHLNELKRLSHVIKEIGKRGAKDYYFKNEGPASALPKVSSKVKQLNTKDFGLRLYCVRISAGLVILLNGDIKTQKNPLDCKNVREHFKFAQKLAKSIDKCIANGEIDPLYYKSFIEKTFEV